MRQRELPRHALEASEQALAQALRRRGFTERLAQDAADFLFHGLPVQRGLDAQAGFQLVVEIAYGECRHDGMSIGDCNDCIVVIAVVLGNGGRETAFGVQTLLIVVCPDFSLGEKYDLMLRIRAEVTGEMQVLAGEVLVREEDSHGARF